jgi:TolB protein
MKHRIIEPDNASLPVKKRTLILLMLLVFACSPFNPATPIALQSPALGTRSADTSPPNQQDVPRKDRWGIYRLDIDTQGVDLLYSSPVEIATLRLNHAGDRFVFSQKTGGNDNHHEEIFTLGIDGSDLRRITDNNFWDLYPAWSPDGSRVAFLSQRDSSLGIYVMNADGGDVRPLYDSSSHEADIDWMGGQIVFTKDSSIWIMQDDGSGVRQMTNPPKAGEWGNANLPFGDYDPRISPDGARVIFERLVNDRSPHGNYDFFVVDTAGSNEFQLSHLGYSQGLAGWSSSGDQILYILAAIDAAGQYDLHLMNTDGTGNRNITPGYFPPEFLCHWAVFSNDDRSIYFIGEWWAME